MSPARFGFFERREGVPGEGFLPPNVGARQPVAYDGEVRRGTGQLVRGEHSDRRQSLDGPHRVADRLVRDGDDELSDELLPFGR